jgi:hypothetical protein
MRIVSALLLILLFSINAIGQGAYHNLIAKGKYDKAAEKLKEDFVKEPAVVSTNYSLARLYNAPEFTSYSTDSAYYLVKRAEMTIHQMK